VPDIDANESPSTIAVIEDDLDRQRDIRSILEFIDYGPILITDSAHWQEVLADTSPVMVVLLGICGKGAQSLSSILTVLQVTDTDLPTILLKNKGNTPELQNEQAANVLCDLEMPLHFEQLTGALHKAQIYRETRRQKELNRSIDLFRSLVGSSHAIRQVRKLMEQVAGSDANVLILGESGTGKEVVARNLHYNSLRRDKPFVPINCGAIPADLLESELFGHEKGAFTGAITSRQGRFEMAEGGTLFLDEIGDMPLTMQVKLLRIIQERTFERVGGNKSIRTDVRIIAATHRNLEDHIKEGKFREDLYYRLNVFPIEMPPLRQRVSDIPILVNDLISRFEHDKRGSVRLTPAAVISLCQYTWPGNVRELANLIERLVILFPYGVVDISDLPEKFRIPGVVAEIESNVEEAVMRDCTQFEPRLPKDGMDLKEYLGNLEYSFIKQALDEAKGVVAHAAERLKMRRTTLVEKLRKYGIQRNDEATNF